MRERDIFIEALETADPSERAALIDDACQGDPLLRERVNQLLAEHERQQSFILDTPPAGLDATIDRPIAERTGTVIGPYKLLQQIGEGGMGVVFMAEQTEPIQRTVALKIIKPGMDTRQVIARFEAERQALAMMDHPNIAKVLDAGTTDSGRPYFVMELVKGVPITRYCDEKHLPLRARLELFVQVCQAVQHAHQKGVIHRDIKPNNVLVAEYDDHAVPKVIDFGVAKATAQKLTERTMFTEFGQLVGTMEYMSPEQAKLNQLDIDTRSDIYSLGVLLYELLAGSTPFEAKRLHEAAFDEMLRIIREEEPPKPSTRLKSGTVPILPSPRGKMGLSPSPALTSLASIAASRGSEPKKLSALIKGELDWVVMKALEKDRNRRYETASGFASDIQRFLDDEAVQACPPSAAYRFRKFARRNKTALTTAALVCVVLMLGTLISTWQAVRATRAERSAAAEAQRAKSEAAIAQAVNDFLNDDLLAQADPNLPYDRYNEPRGELKMTTVLGRAAGQIESRFRDQPLVEAALRQTIGHLYRRFHDKSRAALHLQRAVNLRRAHLGDEHPDTLDSMMSLAWATNDADLTARVLEVHRRLLGEDHPTTLDSVMSVARRFQEKGDHPQAVTRFRQALAGQRRMLEEDDASTAITKFLLACSLRSLDGNIGPSGAHGAEIERLYRESRAAMQEQLGDGSWYTFEITLQLGQFLNAHGHHERAEAVLQDGYARLQSQSAAPPEWAAALAGELEALYRRWGEPPRAAEWASRRLAANKSALSRNARLLRERPDDYAVLVSQASVLMQLQRYDESAATYRATIRLNPQDPWLHQGLGDALAGARKLADAEAAFRAAIRLEPSEGGRHHNLALVLQTQRKFTEAAAEFSEAIRWRPNEHASHYGLGCVHAFGGHWDKAALAFERAIELSPADIGCLYRWAALCFYTNDQENYRRACRALLDHSRHTDDIQIADCTAKACALAPGFGGDAQQVVKLVDNAVFETEAGPARKGFEIAKALVDYRAGRFEPVADIIVRSAPSSEESHGDALALSILAMAQHRLGNVDDARVALANAEGIILTKMPEIEKGETFGDDWHDWLHAQILFREAEKLLNESEPKRSDH